MDRYIEDMFAEFGSARGEGIISTQRSKVSSMIPAEELVRVAVYDRTSEMNKLDPKRSAKLLFEEQHMHHPEWLRVRTYIDTYTQGGYNETETARSIMIKDAQKGLFDMLLIRNARKLSGDLSRAAMILYRLQDYGVSVFIANDDLCGDEWIDTWELLSTEDYR